MRVNGDLSGVRIPAGTDCSKPSKRTGLLAGSWKNAARVRAEAEGSTGDDAGLVILEFLDGRHPAGAS